MRGFVAGMVRGMRPPRGIEGRWQDSSDLNVVHSGQPQFLIKGAAEAEDASLRRRVGVLQSQRDLAVDRPGIDQSAVTLGYKLMKRRMCTVDQAFEIDVHQARVLFDRDTPEITSGADADIVDPDVDPFEALDCRRGDFCGPAWIGNVRFNCDGASAGPLYLKTISSSICLRRAAMTIDEPSAASLMAAPRPKPLEVPTTTTIRSRKLSGRADILDLHGLLY